MAEKTNAIPDDRPQIAAYLCVHDGPAAIRFYEKAFGAVVALRIDMPDGRIGHADLNIGRGAFSLADEFPDLDVLSPKTIGGAGVSLQLYVDDADAVFARAVEAGAKALLPVENQFYGDRGGKLQDPFGHRWFIASRIENLTHDEMIERAQRAAN